MPKIITSKNFLYPITQYWIGHSVLASDGNVYKRIAIEEWLKSSDIY